jgi:hypothetical protein
MDKPLWYGDRGDRRWRSFKKWFRRLRVDWNDHGWKRDPRPIYDTRNGKFCVVGWGDTLCGCFDLKDKQALRFKDTPNGCNCRQCDNPRHQYDGKNLEALTFAERRAFLDDREDWSKRKRREGQHLFRVLCRDCGRHIGTIWVKNGASAYARVRALGWDRRCTSCRKCHFEKLEELERERNAK